MGRHWPLRPYGAWEGSTTHLTGHGHVPSTSVGHGHQPGTSQDKGNLPGRGPLFLRLDTHGASHSHGCLFSPASRPTSHGQQHSLVPLPCMLPVRPGNVLAGVAWGAREGAPLLTVSSCLLLQVVVFNHFLVFVGDTPQALEHHCFGVLQPAEQPVMSQASHFPAACPRER